MGPVELHVLGCGDAMGSGGRLHSSFLLSTGSSRLLIDCGATGLLAMKRFGVDPGSIGTIALTHLHGDHYTGLVFLLLEARHVSKRKAPLAIAGPPGVEARLMSTMELMFPGSTEIGYPFPLTFTELRAGIATTLGEAVITPREVVHPSGAPSLGVARRARRQGDRVLGRHRVERCPDRGLARAPTSSSASACTRCPSPTSTSTIRRC